MTQPNAACVTRRSAVVTALAVCVGGLLGVVGAAPAAAHASLVRSSPADRSSIATAPKTLSLTFDENIRMPSVILVTDADGRSVAQGRTSVVDNIASTGVRIGTAGDYAVVFRVVSADGHPVSGRLTFGVGTGHDGGTLRSSEQASEEHGHDGSSTGTSNAVIGMIASLALHGRRGSAHHSSVGTESLEQVVTTTSTAEPVVAREAVVRWAVGSVLVTTSLLVVVLLQVAAPRRRSPPGCRTLDRSPAGGCPSSAWPQTCSGSRRSVCSSRPPCCSRHPRPRSPRSPRGP